MSVSIGIDISISDAISAGVTVASGVAWVVENHFVLYISLMYRNVHCTSHACAAEI